MFERRWNRPTVRPKPRVKKYISSSELRNLVSQQLGTKLGRRFEIYVADVKYYCPPIIDAQEIIWASTVDRKTWISDRFDCDDFAHVLKAHFAEAAYKNGSRRAAHCFGIVWGSLPGPHAINWMVNSDMKLRFIEPQNDRIFFPRRTEKENLFYVGLK